MARVTARRIFFYVISSFSLLYFAANLHISSLPYHQQLVESGTILTNITSSSSSNNTARPWYMKNGTLWPDQLQNIRNPGHVPLYPEEAEGDRMIHQLNFIPPHVPHNQDSADIPLKKILFWTGAGGWGVKPGRGVFIKEQCPVSSCVISTRRRESSSADLIIFKDHFIMPSFSRPRDQLWMIFMLESPFHTQNFKRPAVFNWTATYRSDSTIVTPYERWEYYQPGVVSRPQTINYAVNKTKQVAWFVSNCEAKNGRLDYARELGKHIQVDIFGACGDKQCPRNSDNCYDKLNTEYKFYLAFENSNCVDYITEKFYVNGLKYNVLPIVMGARKQDYLRVAPHKSFIHVDDYDGPEALAKYLKMLDEDDVRYNEYFQWKGTGEMINTKFFCRLCSLLHDSTVRSESSRHYQDINKWWRGRGTCITRGSWNKLSESSVNHTKVS